MNLLASSLGKDVAFQVGENQIRAAITVPETCQGIVVLVDCGGNEQFSRHRRPMLRSINSAGLATLTLDLLSDSDAVVDCRARHLVFDVSKHSRRLQATVDWLQGQHHFKGLPIGLLTCKTGAAVALQVAAHRPDAVTALVSRGGHPELAGEFLDLVQIPVLLLVDEQDRRAVQRNQKAAQLFRNKPAFEIIPDSSSESDIVEQMRRWLQQQLTKRTLT